MKNLKKWELLSSEDVSPHEKYFPIEKHTVKLTSGRIVDDYYVSPIANVVMLLVLTKTGKLVFVRQYKHGTKEIMIELPAGYCEKGLSIEQNALKELKEETGIIITEKELIPLGRLSTDPTKFSKTDYCFFIKDVEVTSGAEDYDQEEIEVLEITPAEAYKMIADGRIWASGTCAVIARANYLGLI